MLYISIFFYHRYGTAVTMDGNTLRMTGLIFFILAVTVGIAGPILLRAALHHRMIKQKNISADEYIRHNMRLALLSFLTVIFSGVNYLIAAPELYLYGSVFSAIYCIYGIMPANRKIDKEVRYYRTGAENI